MIEEVNTLLDLGKDEIYDREFIHNGTTYKIEKVKEDINAYWLRISNNEINHEYLLFRGKYHLVAFFAEAARLGIEEAFNEEIKNYDNN